LVAKQYYLVTDDAELTAHHSAVINKIDTAINETNDNEDKIDIAIVEINANKEKIDDAIDKINANANNITIVIDEINANHELLLNETRCEFVLHSMP
jgi:ABC-type transporter Mla subunit MlaD